MNRESFLDTIRSRYLEDIRQAYLECEHGPGKPIDYVKLGKILAQLMTSAKKAGLTKAEFDELVGVTLPGFNGNVAAFANYHKAA